MITTLELIELLLKYGPAAFIKLTRGFQTDDPTEEEIEDLRVNAPDTYFVQ